MSLSFNLTFPRGTCPVEVYGDPGEHAAPIVLLFMDAYGPRPVLAAIAGRLVSEGYRVLLPHLFYQHLPYPSLDPEAVARGGEEKQRLISMFQGIDQSMIDDDIRALLAFADKELGTSAPIAATGYCMGGRYALTTATLDSRVMFAASFHGSRLAGDDASSPHLRFNNLTARIYVGVAASDPLFPGEEEGRLATALRDGDIDHVIETYAGTRHGFVMADLPAYHASAAERHWGRLSDHLREVFADAH